MSVQTRTLIKGDRALFNSMSEDNKGESNSLTGALRRAGLRILGGVEAPQGTSKALDDPTMTRLQASYKPPLESQINQIDRGEAWWRDFAWEEYATKELPGLGLGFTVYPYVAVWEKIWGAVPTEDYEKYKLYYTQEPFIRATIDFHTQMTISQGYELEYPLKTVVDDVKKFLDRHDFINLMKIMVKDMLTFGNSYTEVVRTWFCPQTGHDLEKLRISYEVPAKNGKIAYWWTDRVDVAAKHNELYPDHELENPYGEITRFKPLDPMYMRVRRDAYGSLAPTERIIFYNGNVLQMGTIGDYASKITNDNTHEIEYINKSTRLIKHPFSLPSLMGNSIRMAPSPHLLEHNYDGDMYVIETRGGRRIDVTGNHSIFLWQPDNPKQNVKKGKQILKEARDIQIGDYVVLSKSLPIPEHTFSGFSVYQLLSSENLRLWKQNGMVCHKKSRMTERVENIEEMLYTLGLYVAEGSYVFNSHGYRIEWSGDSAEKVIPFLDSIGVKYSYKIRKNGSYGKSDKFYGKIKECPIVSVSNRVFVETIKKLGLLEKTIPSWIFELPNWQLNHFIAGLWDGDGRHNGKMPYFEFYTKDRRLAEDVSLLLTKFGIFAYIYEKDVHKDGVPYYTVQAVVNPVNPIEWNLGVTQKLGMASVGDIVLAKVTKIKKYNYSGPVYDFEVPSTQAFLNANAVVAHNTILGYVQYYVFPLVTFLADEMIHLRYMPTSWTYESVYGVSMLRPILFHQELMKNYEQTMGAIMNVFLRPMFIVKVGGPPGPTGMGVEVTDAQYKAVRRLWQSRVTGQDIVVKSSAPLDIQAINPPIDRMQSTAFWLQWLHNMRTYALSVPKFFTDPAGLNRATAQTVERGYFTFINSNRQSLNSQLEETLMKMIMQSLYGHVADEIIEEYGVPKFIWKPVKEDSLEDKAKTYLPLYASRILTKNEVRKALGFEMLDEEELQEELGESLPPISGAPEGVGALGMTREGTPTFGSPDQKFASRPPTGGAGGGGGPAEGAPPPEEEGAAMMQREQAKQEEEDYLEELEDMKEELKNLKKEAKNYADIEDEIAAATKAMDEYANGPKK
jgi:intein/homing endonuclease